MKCVLFAAVAAMVGCATPTAPKPVAGADPDASAKRVQELLAKLDDNPDILHFDYTPAVSELIELGEPAIEPTFAYLLSDNEATRLHAERATDGAMMTMHGFVRGRGWSNPDGEQVWKRLCATLWDYEAMGRKQVYEAPIEARRAYIERVKQWLASRRA
jgi:hypothetical protein